MCTNNRSELNCDHYICAISRLYIYSIQGSFTLQDIFIYMFACHVSIFAFCLAFFEYIAQTFACAKITLGVCEGRSFTIQPDRRILSMYIYALTRKSAFFFDAETPQNAHSHTQNFPCKTIYVFKACCRSYICDEF